MCQVLCIKDTKTYKVDNVPAPHNTHILMGQVVFLSDIQVEISWRQSNIGIWWSWEILELEIKIFGSHCLRDDTQRWWTGWDLPGKQRKEDKRVHDHTLNYSRASSRQKQEYFFLWKRRTYTDKLVDLIGRKWSSSGLTFCNTQHTQRVFLYLESN